jgi:hypothetical protein
MLASPPPPPPAALRVSATLELSGYTEASFGASEQRAFCAAVSATLGISVSDVVVTSVSDSAAAARRRTLQAGGVRVAFTVAAASTAAAQSLRSSLNLVATGAGASVLVASLQSAGLTAVSGVSLAAAPEVQDDAAAPPASGAPSVSADGSTSDIAVIAGAAGGGGGGALLLVGGAVWFAVRRRRLLQLPPSALPARFRYDVFLSYRRDDGAMVDLIEDKLCHCARRHARTLVLRSVCLLTRCSCAAPQGSATCASSATSVATWRARTLT